LQTCVVLSSSHMECPSPPINLEFLSVVKSRRRRSPKYPRSLNKYRESAYRIGFHMDNVEAVKDLEKYFDSIPSLLTYVEDPKIFQFPNQIKLYKGDTLVIEVRYSYCCPCDSLFRV
jgi:plexin A